MRIEMSPLFRIAQENNQKLINPLVRIFKATDDKISEHYYIPLNPEHTDVKRYERIAVDKKRISHDPKIVFFVSPITPYHKALSPQLHGFEHVY